MEVTKITRSGADPPGPDAEGVGAAGPTPDGRVRVVLAHGSPFLRDGLLLALTPASGMNVVGVARDREELGELVARLAPDVTLASPELVDGMTLPRLAVLIEAAGDERVGELYAAGARCVIPAHVGRERLVTLLGRVAAGERIVLDATQEELTRAEPEPGSRFRREPRRLDRPRERRDLQEGLAVTAAARGLVAVMALAAAIGALGGLPRPTLTWGLVLVMAGWTAVSVAFVRRPPPLPPSAGIAVDLAFAVAFGLAFSDVRAATVPFSVLLVAFALRASPVLVIVAAGAGTAVIALLAFVSDGASTLPRIGILVTVGLTATMVAVARTRRDRDLSSLIAARRELLAEALSAELRARRLIAEELHDDPLQLLLAARQDLEEREDDPDAVERASAVLAEATVRFRAVMARSTDPGGPGRLRERLEELCTRQAARGGYAWTVTVAPGLATVLDDLLHTLATELVGNVTKHAGASSLTVRVASGNGGVVLTVTDDGTGIVPGRLQLAADEGHLGMRALRRRVAAAEGTLAIDSAPGEGTTVRIGLPTPVRG